MIIPKTHSLNKLSTLAIKDKDKLIKLKADVELLDRIYIPSRYPDALPGSLPEGLPDKKDAHQAYKSAVVFYQLALDTTKLSPVAL